MYHIWMISGSRELWESAGQWFCTAPPAKGETALPRRSLPARHGQLPALGAPSDWLQKTWVLLNCPKVWTQWTEIVTFPHLHLSLAAPMGSISSMEVNVDVLEQMDLMDISDQEALDVFLNSGSGADEGALTSPISGESTWMSEFWKR